MKHFTLFFSIIFIGQFAFASDNINLQTLVVNVATSNGELRTEIHFAEKDLSVARRAEEIIRKDLTKAVDYFHYVPKDIVHFNIDPFKRVTNGNATIFPTNVVNLYNFPASNSEHLIILEDWLQGLMFHEFIHIIHLDQTRDFLDVGRNIFGTIAKVPPGIVPHWFTEGIAVWGESTFLASGRLQNESMNRDLWLQFQNINYCSTIDCLDNPGLYPFGQFAYWAGGHFMKFLENKKLNTIRCLVFENSKQIPFFLNNAFENCTGNTAQKLFSEFRIDYLKKFNSETIKNENIINVFGTDDFQKGQLKTGDLLLKVERQKKKSALVRYDLKDKINTFHIYNEPIDHIGNSVKMGEETETVLVAFNDDPNFSDHNKIWKLINTDTLLEEKTLSFTHDPSYVIPFSESDFLSFSFENAQWRAFRNEKLIREWPINYNIVGVYKNDEQITLKINTANVGTFTYFSDPSLEKIEKDGVKVEFIGPEKIIPENKVETYPKLKHLKPHYWFLAFGNSNSPGSIGAMTTVSDPMSVHSFSITGLVFPSVGKVGGSGDYTHTNFYGKKTWLQYFLISRDYSTNTWSDNLNKEEEIAVGSGYQFDLLKWTYAPKINLGKSATNNAISNQQNIYWTFSQVVAYQAMSENDFWNNFNASFDLGASTQSVGDPYYKIYTKISFTNNLTDDFSLKFKASYGKLFKNTFTEGLLFGGGIEGMQQSRKYEFYGLQYGDAYGNLIFTSRFTNDLNIFNYYRGHNFFPFYLKEVHLLFGIETLTADRIFIDNHFYKNSNVSSIFIGPSLLTNLFYFVPTNIDFILSSTTTPNGKKVGYANLFLKLDL